MSYRTVPRNNRKRLGDRTRRTPSAPAPRADLASPAPRGPGRLFVEPDAVRSAADQLGGETARLGGRLAELPSAARSADEARQILEVDPAVRHVSTLISSGVLRYPLVVQRSGVSGAAHKALREQMEAFAGAYLGAMARAEDVEDSLRVVGASKRTMREALRAAIPVALASGSLPAEEEAGLRPLWLAIQAEEARQKDRLLSAQGEAARVGAAGSAALQRAKDRDAFVASVLDLKRGASLDPARAAATLRTYDELQAEQVEAADAQTGAGQGPERRRSRRR